MIVVTFKRNEHHHILSFTMSGHADAGPYGYDLVCAGVSAVSIGTVNAIAELCGIELETEMGEEGGFLRCRVPDGLDGATFEKVQLLLEGMKVSLQSIADEYSEHITIEK
ncbi:ribosomal-processing cysteine protease Prp [Halalkalibacterium ligniniphilum]|uniref:ribosomal-processing cysteine protease Prp n=1 Tax=Halalkalibacterium ligniniphilum TaxID=1134413 RepID=UPI00034A9671|nr:ribosomal-processing cysteine protease Prp [Halalkalibacterium ligniniphilum]